MAGRSHDATAALPVTAGTASAGTASTGTASTGAASGGDDRYRWVALANTTASVFMSALDGSIVIIALPAIFRGIHLDPLSAGNIFYLLWMIMGYRLVQAVLVVTLGRLGDMFGRVRIYNAGFAVFTAASILLSFDPFTARAAALWLIGWRVLQAVGGSMLMANSAAILTDAFPPDRRGFALGLNQVAAIAGQFVGLVAGGLLAALDWRAVFWINVPVGIYGTAWAYFKLRDKGERHRSRIDWWGNVTFALGLGAVLVALTIGIQPYGGHTMGWTSPVVIGLLAGGILLLVAFALVETRVADPMFQLSLFKIRAFTAGNVAGLAVAIARGGLQFTLIIWLQGIWLPLHGYNYSDTPLWAGIFLLPLTAGILISGPISGALSDRFGARGFATAGMIIFGASFIGLIIMPVIFPYWIFALLTFANGVGGGMFAAPNSASIMSSVPARHRGAASGMRATYQNSATALSIGVFFSLMIAGLAASLPHTLSRGLEQHSVPYPIARQVAGLPPVSSLFAAVLGVNPVQHMLAAAGALSALPQSSRQILTGREFFPQLISGPFHQGLVIALSVSAVLAAVAAVASLLRGGRYVYTDPSGTATANGAAVTVTSPAIEPARTALLVMDYQVGVLNRIPGADDLLKRAAETIEQLRRHGVQIGFVRVAFEDADYDAIPPTSMLWSRVTSARNDYHADSPLTAVHAQLSPHSDDIVVRKTRVGAFSTTDLDKQLRDRGIDTLLLAGLSTSGVMLSTVRDAHDRDYQVFVIADLTADPDPDVHEFLTGKIFPRQARVITAADLDTMLATENQLTS
ncbi:MAG TPA: MFS transporter [Streptosporangiaceae bacterium]|nr:MFS transporter [Streptosporangiaceae bacterium]